MSTLINQLRSIIQDKATHVVDLITFDGATKIFRLKYYPIILGSVTVTPMPTSINLETGVLTYASAPPAGDPGIPITCDYDTVMLSDLNIQDIIDIQTSLTVPPVDIRLIAAACLDAMASNQAVILKRITLQDLETDGPSVAKALRDHAVTLRQQVYDPKFQEPSFEIIEQINDTPGFREKVLKDIYRNANNLSGDDDVIQEVVDLTSNITFPQAGISFLPSLGTPNAIIATRVGKQITIAFDTDFILHADGLDHLEVRLPTGFEAQQGIDNTSVFTYRVETAPNVDSNNILGNMFIQARTGSNIIALYPFDYGVFPRTDDIYIAGQITYLGL